MQKRRLFALVLVLPILAFAQNIQVYYYAADFSYSDHVNILIYAKSLVNLTEIDLNANLPNFTGPSDNQYVRNIQFVGMDTTIRPTGSPIYIHSGNTNVQSFAKYMLVDAYASNVTVGTDFKFSFDLYFKNGYTCDTVLLNATSLAQGATVFEGIPSNTGILNQQNWQCWKFTSTAAACLCNGTIGINVIDVNPFHPKILAGSDSVDVRFTGTFYFKDVRCNCTATKSVLTVDGKSYPQTGEADNIATHTFTSPGTYNVDLAVYHSGCDGETVNPKHSAPQTIVVTKDNVNWANLISIDSVYFYDNSEIDDNNTKGIMIMAFINNTSSYSLSGYSFNVNIQDVNPSDFEPIPFNNPTNIGPGLTVPFIAKIRYIPQPFLSKSISINLVYTGDTVASFHRNISIWYSLNNQGRPFNMYKDAYGFKNFQLGENNSLQIAMEDKRLLALTEFVSGILGGGGFCYGMAASSGLYFENNTLKPTSALGQNTHTMTPDEHDVIKNIINYHSECPFVLADYWQTESVALQSLITNLSSGKPAILGHKFDALGMLNPFSGGLHATLAYKMVLNEDDNIAYVINYDNDTIIPQAAPNTCLAILNVKKNTYRYGNWNKLVVYDLPSPITDVSSAIVRAYTDLNTFLLSTATKGFYFGCPIQPFFQDSMGNITGCVNGSIVNNIPNSFVQHFMLNKSTADSAYFFRMPGNEKYNIRINGTSNGKMNLCIFQSLSQNEVLSVSFDSMPIVNGSSCYLNQSYDTLTIDKKVYVGTKNVVNSAIVSVISPNRGGSWIFGKSYTGKRVTRVHLFDAMGRHILTQEIKNGRFGPFDKIGKGIYLARIDLENNTTYYSRVQIR